MFVIGVAGQAQNGKDTLADYIHLKINELQKEVEWHRSSLAKNVKKVFAETFNVSYEFIEKWKTRDEIPEGFNMPIRKALQFIGDGFRGIQNDIWLDSCFRDETRNVIISDVRYLNEARRIHTYRGVNILIAHPYRINNDPNGSEAEIRPYSVYFLNQVGFPPHTELFDIFIKNDGSIEDLYAKADELIIPYIIEHFKGENYALYS
jgi:DNA-binding transcriptional regulator YiaG